MVLTNRLKNWMLALLVNFMWAAQYPAYKVASDSMTIAALNTYTFAIASVAILPFVLMQRLQGGGSKIGLTALGHFVILAILGVVPPSIIQSWGIQNSTASNGAILSLAIPIMMTLMGILLLGERPRKTLYLSLTLALVGTILISWRDVAGGAFTGPLLMGNIAILVGGIGSSFFNAYGKKVLRNCTGLETLLFTNLIVFIFSALLSCGIDNQPFYSTTKATPEAWLGVVVLGAFSWGLAMALWMRLLKQLEVSQVAVTVYMLPVLGVLLAVVTLGESLAVSQCFGALIVLTSAYVSSSQPDSAEITQA